MILHLAFFYLTFLRDHFKLAHADCLQSFAALSSTTVDYLYLYFLVHCANKSVE